MDPRPEPLVPLTVAPHLLSRLFRHEIGNFLQAVYSTTAVLKRRLPAEAEPLLELSAELRLQADACRLLLDTIHDFLSPQSLNCELLNLGALAQAIVTRAAARNSHLRISANTDGSTTIQGDAQRLAQAGALLLSRACEAAREAVEFRSAVNPDTGEAEWQVIDDGPGLPADELEPLFASLLLLRGQRLVQGLAPVRQIVALHGGKIHAGRLAEGGFSVRIVLPVGGPTARPGAQES
jgi:signal transduction histidine kinase